ncbi:MAG: Hcp family type VI secretion system effector [Thermodesulfobacteriota bacterium]
MAMTGYMKLEGKNQGEIKGGCTQEGREDMILVYGISHHIEIPKDTHTGLPTGQRIHHPFLITKEIDKGSPLLYQACCSGEQFNNVEVDYYRINEKGQEEHYYTVKLQNAIIVSMTTYKPLTFLEQNKPYKDMEDVQFTYEKIIWTYESDGIESEDSWKTPKS